MENSLALSTKIKCMRFQLQLSTHRNAYIGDLEPRTRMLMTVFFAWKLKTTKVSTLCHIVAQRNIIATAE